MAQPSILKSNEHSKMIETHFYRLYFINHCWFSFKSMVPNFVVAISVLLPMCVTLAGVFHICAFLLKKLSCYNYAIIDKWV